MCRCSWRRPSEPRSRHEKNETTAKLAQINLAVNTWLATSQGEGAVTALTYAFRLMYLPIGVFGVSIATASLPEISRQAAIDDVRAIRGSVSRGLRMMLMLNVPAAVGLMVLANPIVAMIYERGEFLPLDTYATSAVEHAMDAPNAAGG